MTRISLWQDRPRRPLPAEAREVSGHYDVAVVGAGLDRTDDGAAPRPRREDGGGPRGRVRRCRHHRPHHRQDQLPAGHPAVDDRGQARPTRSSAQYVEAQREGLAWLERFCAEPRRAGAATRRRAPTRTPRDGEPPVRDELELAARGRAWPVEWDDELPLPFPTRGAVAPPRPAAARPDGAARRACLSRPSHTGCTWSSGARVTKVSRLGPGPGSHRRRATSRPTGSSSRPTCRSSTGAGSSHG